MATMTRERECSAATTCLRMAFELGERSWKLGFSTGTGQRPRVRRITAGAIEAIAPEIVKAKARLGLPLDAPVRSCYEAGREAFWLHRYLVAHGMTNHVVDSSSIEVNRRARRAKTDRLDLAGLLNLLARYVQGDQRAWRVVRVPSVADEDARHLPRTWETLTADRTRLINRLKSLLMTQGVQVPIDKDFLAHVRAARLWDGSPVPAGLHERLRQDWAQLQQVPEAGRVHHRDTAFEKGRSRQASPIRFWCSVPRTDTDRSCVGAMLLRHEAASRLWASRVTSGGKWDAGFGARRPRRLSQ